MRWPREFERSWRSWSSVFDWLIEERDVGIFKFITGWQAGKGCREDMIVIIKINEKELVEYIWTKSLSADRN